MFGIIFIVAKRKKYALVALLGGLAMALSSYYLTVINVFHKSILIFAEMNGVYFTLLTIILNLAIAVLFGLYLALLIFRRDVIKARALANKAAGFGGVGVALLASGCPSCGVPILGLVGLPLGLLSLPFKGIELKLISIAFLLLSIYLIDRNIKNSLKCEIQIKKPD